MKTPYYDEDGITIYHGDCREVLPALDTFDLIFTSPPYNLGVSSGGGLLSALGNGRWARADLAHGYGEHADAMDPADYVLWQKAVLIDLWAHTSESGAIFYNHKPRVQDGVLHTPFELNPGLPVRQVIVWARAGGFNFSPTFYVPTHEWIVVYARPAFRLKSKEASGAGDLWRVPQESHTKHPAPFPVSLPARAIETTGPSVVLDPFLGSGSTLVAAKAAGVKGVGIEINEAYCELAAKRLAQGSLFSEAG